MSGSASVSVLFVREDAFLSGHQRGRCCTQRTNIPAPEMRLCAAGGQTWSHDAFVSKPNTKEKGFVTCVLKLQRNISIFVNVDMYVAVGYDDDQNCSDRKLREIYDTASQQNTKIQSWVLTAHSRLTTKA